MDACQKRKKPAIGYQNYAEVIEGNILYVDKTDFIREWWEYADKVTLITRPRRFGKTLNMSMIECFFSNKYSNRSDLFEGLSIFSGEDSETYRALQGTFPVIALSFANVKGKDYPDMEYRLTEIISKLYEENRYLLEGSCLSENEKEYYRSIKPGIGVSVVADTLNRMACFMKRYHGKDVIILLDEYDTPMQEAWLGGYWDEAVAFTRGLFNSTFKTNKCLYRGIITGITRISKESIFSDLNNLEVITMTSDKYGTAFGFTEQEVFDALDYSGLDTEKEKVKHWYDGFTFGKYTDIYNPWSIIGFIGSGGKYMTYWANTSGNGLVNSLIRLGNREIKCTMEDLLAGRTLRAEIDEQILFNQLNGNPDAVWSMLLATGYLKVLKVEPGDDGDGADNVWYTLAITNTETRRMFKKMIGGWFANNGAAQSYNAFVKSLLMNDVESMNEFMNKVALHTFSSFDTAGNVSDDDAPERFYHGFVLGLMVELAGRFELKSNRESGFGRYDVMLIPSDRERDDAYIIEFKVHKPKKEETLETTVANAHKQIEEKQYEAELVSRGFLRERIRKYGFAFQGKEVLIG